MKCPECNSGKTNREDQAVSDDIIHQVYNCVDCDCVFSVYSKITEIKIILEGDKR